MTARTGNPARSATVVLGRVGAPFGVQGWVKVSSYTDPPEGIADYPVWTLAAGGATREVEVLDSKLAGRGVAVRLAGVETIEAARALTGAEIQVDRAALPPVARRRVLSARPAWIRRRSTARDSRWGRSTAFSSCRRTPWWCCAASVKGWCRWYPSASSRWTSRLGRVTLDWHADD